MSKPSVVFKKSAHYRARWPWANSWSSRRMSTSGINDSSQPATSHSSRTDRIHPVCIHSSYSQHITALTSSTTKTSAQNAPRAMTAALLVTRALYVVAIRPWVNGFGSHQTDCKIPQGLMQNKDNRGAVLSGPSHSTSPMPIGLSWSL